MVGDPTDLPVSIRDHGLFPEAGSAPLARWWCEIEDRPASDAYHQGLGADFSRQARQVQGLGFTGPGVSIRGAMAYLRGPANLAELPNPPRVEPDCVVPEDITTFTDASIWPASPAMLGIGSFASWEPGSQRAHTALELLLAHAGGDVAKGRGLLAAACGPNLGTGRVELAAVVLALF